MADIQIRLDQLADRDQWPQSCMRCNKEQATLVAVPQRYCGGAESLAVPLCDEHRDHWQRFRWKNKIGILIIVLFLILVGAVVWIVSANELWPPRLRGFQRFDAVGVSIFVGLLAVALPLLIWIGSAPIRVTETTSNRLTLSGVAKSFALAWGERQATPIPAATDIELRVDVEPYRPDGRAPYPGAAYQFVTPTLVGVIFGVVSGFVQRWVDTATANWDKQDWRFLLASAGVLLGYWLMVTVVFRFSLRFWLMAVLLGAVVSVVFVAIGAFIIGLAGFGFSVCLSFFLFLPLYLFFTWVLVEAVKHHCIRNARIVFIASIVAMAAFTAMAWLVCGSTTPITLGLFFGMTSAAAAAKQAKSPFCVGCESWMQKKHLGAVLRPRSEVQPLIENGDLSRLASLPVQQFADVGDISFKMHCCPNCGDASTIVLEMVDHVPNSNNKKRADEKTVGRWIYPANVMPVLEELFPAEKDGDGAETAQTTSIADENA